MNFIEMYDDALSSDECNVLIDYFHSHSKCEGGVWSDGRVVVNPLHKKSIELDRAAFSIHKTISDIVYPSLVKYTGKYLESYKVLNHVSNWRVDDDFSFKKFEHEDDGFKVWHTEHTTSTPKRILVWMFYLNDALSGTEFEYHPKVEAKEGRLLIWPSFWTHYHRSEPNKGLKYIISGWYSFN